MFIYLVSSMNKKIAPHTPKATTKPFQKSDGNCKDFELDHLISLQLGGHPKAVKNLWPEPYLKNMTNFTAHV
jgi:hypothetical protein